MNKLIISISFIVILNILAFANNINFNDIVDLNKKHWAYKSCFNLIEKYKIMKPYKDHTFRGNKNVNRYQFFNIINKTIKYIENTKNISIKKDTKNNIIFEDLNKSHFSYKNIDELVNEYHIKLSDMESEINGDFNITRYELAYIIYEIIKRFKNIEDNNIENIYIKSSENIVNLKIMSLSKDNDFEGDKFITRYELATVINNLIEYLGKSQTTNLN